KKKEKELIRERENFVSGNAHEGITGACAHGISKTVANEIFDEIVAFANYAFNKAHAAAYAVVSYQTAYMKFHYPKEYMAALLTSVLDNSGKLTEYMDTCREMGIRVLPPDINESSDSFTVSGDNIRFGLVAVKNIGRGLIKSVVAERAERGNFTSLQDFCERMFERELSRRAIENLIKCGAFDAFGYRSQHIQVFDRIMDSIAYNRTKNVAGQMDLFNMGGQESLDKITLPSITELSKKQLLTMERETTGMYLSGHPLDDWTELLKRLDITRVATLSDDSEDNTAMLDGKQVLLAGTVSSVRTKMTRNNALMAYVVLEDLSGSIEMLVFPKVLERCGSVIVQDALVVVRGRVSVRENGAPQVLCDEVTPIEIYSPPEPAKEKAPENKRVYLRISKSTDAQYTILHDLLAAFPGERETIIYFADTGKKIRTYIYDDVRIITRITEMLGSQNVVVK
ncbi:MAG: OB-fold nucleic acid binding domain-containing protein, partial [Clostridia bacterium]